MKNLPCFALLIFLLAACTENSKKPEVAKPVTQMVNQDSAGIAQSLHGFFKWYADNGEQLITKYDFINISGKNPKLDEKILSDYLAEFKKTGFVSDELIDWERKFYRACAKLWATEEVGDLLSGMDADRYYCAQEIIGDYTTASVKAKIMGERAAVTLEVKEPGETSFPVEFEMKKENGKWLLAKVGCDLEVAY